MRHVAALPRHTDFGHVLHPSTSMSTAAQVGVFASGALLGAAGAAAWVRSRKATAPVTELTTRPLAHAGQVAVVNDALALSGHPGPVHDLLQHAAYISSYDRRLRHPHWTAEHITAESLKRAPGTDGANRAQSFFQEDARIPEIFRSTNAAYFRSGYDRGHMVPAADAKMSQAAMNETFLLSNIAPQVGEGMNRDYWAHTEDFVRRLANQFDDLYVFTIPLYLPRQSSDGKWRISYEVIGSPPTVSVPTHFAKVILGSGPKTGHSSLLAATGLGNSVALGAFVMPNSRIPDTAPLLSFETDGRCRDDADFSRECRARGRAHIIPPRAQVVGQETVRRSQVRNHLARLYEDEQEGRGRHPARGEPNARAHRPPVATRTRHVSLAWHRSF